MKQLSSNAGNTFVYYFANVKNATAVSLLSVLGFGLIGTALGLNAPDGNYSRLSSLVCFSDLGTTYGILNTLGHQTFNVG